VSCIPPPSSARRPTLGSRLYPPFERPHRPRVRLAYYGSDRRRELMRDDDRHGTHGLLGYQLVARPATIGREPAGNTSRERNAWRSSSALFSLPTTIRRSSGHCRLAQTRQRGNPRLNAALMKLVSWTADVLYFRAGEAAEAPIVDDVLTAMGDLSVERQSQPCQRIPGLGVTGVCSR